MALESFYGGKQGVSPVIKAKFKYVTAEKDNGTYYDEAYGVKINSRTKLTQEEAVYLNDFFDNKIYEADQFVTWSDQAKATLNGKTNTYTLITPFVMDECLKNVNYTDVWYGELCIIDTDSKMNPNNGKLYRRTLKQVKNQYRNTGDTLYAEYVGQIVGPSGGVPNFDFGSLDAERQKAVGDLETYKGEQVKDNQGNPIGKIDNSTWEYAYREGNPEEDSKETGTGITSVVPETYKHIAILNSGTPEIAGNNIANIQMVPGKESANKWNDTIRYTWCNVRRKFDDKADDAWIYLGFEIPYTTFDASGEEENYTYNGPIFIDTSSTQDGQKQHPFSKRYEFHIPRGARGIGPEELFIVGKDGRNKPTTLYDFDVIHYDYENDIYSILDGTPSVDPNSNVKEKRPHKRDSNNQIIENQYIDQTATYWVAKWRLYNPKTTNIIDVYQYIGAYRDIKNIRLQDTGELDILYSDSNNWQPLKTLTWITNASLETKITDESYGQFKVTFNNNKIPEINKNLHLIKNVNYNDKTGEITFTYSEQQNSETPGVETLDITTGNIEYIKDLTINTTRGNSDYGKVTGTKNTNGTVDLGTLPLIKSVEYKENTGIITFNYANGLEVPSAAIDPDNPNDPKKNYGDLISYISKMQITDNGTIQYQLNTESGNTWHDITDGSTTPEPLRIKDIDNLVIKTPTNNSIQVSSGDPAINGHLYVKYRGEEKYEDLGLVKGNAVVGPVYTLKNTDENGNLINEGYFKAADNTTDGALNALSTSIFNEEAANSVGGNGEERGNGHITANGVDVSGGLVAAQIKPDANTEPYTALYYYNTESQQWVSAGTIGEISSGGQGNSNIYIQEQSSVSGGEGETYPKETDLNPKIYFKNGLNPYGSIGIQNRDNSYYDYRNMNVLGFMPWQNPKADIIQIA